MERNLTVYESNFSHWNNLIPKIVLQGKWLKDCGYSVGNKISVKVENENNNPQLIVKLANI